MSIINLANAMYSKKAFSSQPQHEIDDRLDAARALLGVSPNSVATGDDSLALFGGREGKAAEKPALAGNVSPPTTTSEGRPRSGSVGLEALAFFATKEKATMETEQASQQPASGNHEAVVANAQFCSSSSDDDSEAMPPPPPRLTSNARRRSVSNPEGMEKWAPVERSRLHLVLPASILEEELAEANAALRAKEEREEEEASGSGEDLSSETKDDEEDEELLDQDELLRRARSRLLEDLSEGNMNRDKGVVALPHSLAKYKEVYSKNGRVGIYTRAERSAIIARFHSKRSRRVWNKKIRYNCRKSLADRRMRVKGRFVKRATEAQAKKVAAAIREPKHVTPDSSATEDGATKDAEMPDVNDPEAGFSPTEDQPYRRLRRHTIT